MPGLAPPPQPLCLIGRDSRRAGQPEPEILAVEADSFDGMVEFALPKLVDLQPNAMFTVTANEDEMSVAIESARAFVDSLTSFKTKCVRWVRLTPAPPPRLTADPRSIVGRLLG